MQWPTVLHDVHITVTDAVKHEPETNSKPHIKFRKAERLCDVLDCEPGTEVQTHS